MADTDMASVTRLEDLGEDGMVVMLSHVEDLGPMFKCSKPIEALSGSAGLQDMWLKQRTNKQLVGILTKAVYMDYGQRLQLLLADTVRARFSATQLATAMLDAISAHNADAMEMLLPYCDVTLKVSHECKLSHAHAHSSGELGLMWCKIKVFGTQKELLLMTRVSTAGGRVTYNEVPKDPGCANKGITVILGTPEGEKRVQPRLVSQSLAQV